MLINLSNHPSECWDSLQKKAASEYGAILDIPFPAIPPEADSNQINPIVDEYYKKVLSLAHDRSDHAGNSSADRLTVMIQGEFTFVYRLVKKLETAGVPCVAACTERVAQEENGSDGARIKKSVFRFVRFREYW